MGLFDFLGKGGPAHHRAPATSVFGRKAVRTGTRRFPFLDVGRAQELTPEEREERYHQARAGAYADTGQARGGVDDLEEFLAGVVMPVVSSWHAQAWWDAGREVLTIAFNQGGGMIVGNVTAGEAADYFQAPSHGTFAWDNWLVRGEGNGGKVKKPVHWF